MTKKITVTLISRLLRSNPCVWWRFYTVETNKVAMIADGIVFTGEIATGSCKVGLSTFLCY